MPAFLHRLVDDAALFPPGNASLAEAVHANRGWHSTPYHQLVGSFVVDDRRVVDLGTAVSAARSAGVQDLDDPLRVSVVVTGGAGALGPAVTWTERSGLALAGVETAVRDLDDPAGSTRRVLAAADDLVAAGELDEDVPLYVEPPRLRGGEPAASWLAALDEVAATDHRLKLRTGGVEADAFPGSAELATCLAAALDRELRFKCTAGLHHALRHRDPATGFEHHGFLNVLVATRASLDGADVREVSAVLDETDPGRLLGRTDEAGLARSRHWFTSFGSCSISDPVHDLTVLGLVGR